MVGSGLSSARPTPGIADKLMRPAARRTTVFDRPGAFMTASPAGDGPARILPGLHERPPRIGRCYDRVTRVHLSRPGLLLPLRPTAQWQNQRGVVPYLRVLLALMLPAFRFDLPRAETVHAGPLHLKRRFAFVIRLQLYLLLPVGQN